MKTPRISIVLFAAALFFGTCYSPLCFAQQRDPVVQTTPKFEPAVQTQVTAMLYPKRSVRPDGHMGTASVSFEVIGLDSNSMDVSDGAEHTVDLEIRNTSSSPITIYFKRSQRLASGWSSSVCWAGYCFAATVDSAITATPVAPGDTVSLSLNMTPALSDYPDSSIAWLRVGVVGSVADSIQLVYHAGFKAGNPPVVFSWAYGSKFQYAFSGTGTHSFINSFENLSGDSTYYNFTFQDILPQGWTVQHCVLGVSDSCTSGANIRHLFGPVGQDSATANNPSNQNVKITLKGQVLTKKDSAIFFVSVRPSIFDIKTHPTQENPADSANYRFVAVFNTHLLDLLNGVPVKNVMTYPFAAGGTGTVTGQFKNLLTIPETYHFSLNTALPTGWSLQNYCVGDSCATGTDVTNLFDAVNGANAIQNIVFTFQTQTFSQPETDTLYLSSYPVDNPGDLRIDTFYAVATPQSGVAANTEDASAGLAVTNAWPNPVYSSGKLTLDILTDRGGECLARIYDISGIEQATADLGTLHAGANEVQIASPNLHTGEYIIRIEQGNEASEVVRINYIR